jgi:hypothetical protein
MTKRTDDFTFPDRAFPSDQRHRRHDPGQAEGRIAQDLNQNGGLLHRTRLRQSHGHERIDWHKSDDHARAGEFAGAPPNFASIFRLRHAAHGHRRR